MLLRGVELPTWTLPQRHWPVVFVDDICTDSTALQLCRSVLLSRKESKLSSRTGSWLERSRSYKAQSKDAVLKEEVAGERGSTWYHNHVIGKVDKT